MARILLISTYPPQECGIATYTRALIRGIETVHPQGVCHVAVPLDGTHDVLPFGKRMFTTFGGDSPAEYRRVAEKINESNYDVVWLQHEFGIFSGEWGCNILELCRALKKPLITTLHTVLEEPPEPARRITRELVKMSAAVTVMVDIARTMLAKGYGIASKKVVQVPHGVPDVVFRDSDSVKNFSLSGMNVLSTFGLLSSGKGIEYAIEAMPAIVKKFPNTIYKVLGATHPKVKQNEGESYRLKLMTRACELGVAENVEFVGRYLSLDQIIQYLQSTDVYITPYIGRSQISSGTLAYALSCGKAMVSTPYLYAQEILGNGRGRLAEFEDPDSIARCVIEMLANPVERRRMEKECYAYSRQMTWTAVGTRHVAMANRAAAEQRRLVATAAFVPSKSTRPVVQPAKVAGALRAPMVS